MDFSAMTWPPSGVGGFTSSLVCYCSVITPRSVKASPTRLTTWLGVSSALTM